MTSFQALAAAAALTVAALSPALAAPVSYTVDSSHTFPRFSYSHMGYSTQLSSFTNTSGTVVFDAVAKTGAVDIVIDMTTVNTGSADFNGHIQAEGFLETAKFPKATFKSTKVVFDGDKPASVEGQLTIKGVSKPVILTITSFQALPHPMMKVPVLGANAFTTIKRTEFGAGKYAPYVGDEVRIDIAIEAIAK
jgi:polyisoprenoid-binding protein YceI